MMRYLILTVAMVLVVGGGVAIAQPEDDGTVINACADNNDGNLRIVESPDECKNSEHPVSWNAVGPQGPTGPAGPQGDPGVDGEDGADGAHGADGEDGADGTNGTNGADGLSAYEVWLAAGNTGDEAAFLASLVGPQGEPGTDGQDGADGAQGPPGVLGFYRLHVVHEDVAPGSNHISSVACESGDVATGGGYFASYLKDVTVTASFPWATGLGVPVEWKTYYRNNGTSATDVDVLTFVVCADVTP